MPQAEHPAAAGTAAPNSTQIRNAHVKVMYAGMALTLGFPAVLLLVGHLLRPDAAPADQTAVPGRVLFYALLAVALAEIPAALIVKKVLLRPLTEALPPAAVPTVSTVFSRYLVLFNLAAACPVYGLVWYLLGGTMPEFVLFAVVGLLIFRLVRPSTEFFYSLFGARPAIE